MMKHEKDIFRIKPDNFARETHQKSRNVSNMMITRVSPANFV